MNKKLIKVCQVCKKEYWVYPYQYNRSKTCCRKCHNSWAGKIGGKAGKGITRNNGAKRPQLSLRNKLFPLKREKNPAWKGGITPLMKRIRHSFQYRQWRSDVFTRDNFTCQDCGRRGGDLEAHHFLKEFAKIIEECKITTFEQAMKCEELWNINNGITLCKKCHNKTKHFVLNSIIK
jgi:5-methylcytosine-specific restriction endonuclease McrA